MRRLESLLLKSGEAHIALRVVIVFAVLAIGWFAGRYTDVLIGAAVLLALAWLARDVMASLQSLEPARRWRILFRLAYLVASAAALAVLCRQGTSLPALGVLFAVYISAVTLWVRGQHQAWVDAAAAKDPALRPWTVPYESSAFAIVVGLAFATTGFFRHVSTAFLAGLMLAYLGAGYLLMRYRGSQSELAELQRRVWPWLGVLLFAVACLVGALALMPHSLWAAGLLIVPVLLLPSALSVLAEPALVKVRETRGLWKGVLLLGVAVYLVGFAVAFALQPHAAIVIAFAILGLLMIAIVSSTQADIATVVGVVLLMGVTSLSDPKPDFLKPALGRVDLVILGDSYISGEGAEIFYEEQQGHGEPRNRCHRAPSSWAAITAQRRSKPALFLACSGARTHNVRKDAGVGEDSNRQYNEPDTQLDQLAEYAPLNPSLVLVSLGGNDVGFSTIGMMCLAPGDCNALLGTWKSSLPELEVTLTETFTKIREQFPSTTRIVVAPYPLPVFTRKDGTCDGVALSEGDRAFINGFLPELNNTVQRAAAADGVKFEFLEGMKSVLADAHLQLCDPVNNNRPGLNFIGLRSVGGVAEQRFNPQYWYHNSLHPNERGHAAMVRVFEPWREQRIPAESPPPAPESSPAACVLSKTKPTDTLCTAVGQKWALERVRDKLLSGWLWLLAFTAVGAWLIGVALFGAKKSWWPNAI